MRRASCIRAVGMAGVRVVEEVRERESIWWSINWGQQ